MKHNLSRILLAVGLALFAQAALAQASQSVTITAAVAKSCAVSGFTDVTFPTAYDPNAAAALQGTGQVVVQCTKGTTYYWTVSDGAHSGATRRLSDAAAAEFIPYGIEATSNAGTTYTAAPMGMVAGVMGAKATGRALPMSLGLRVSLTPLQDVSTDIGDFTDIVDVGIDIAP